MKISDFSPNPSDNPDTGEAPEDVRDLRKDALEFHARGRPGKIEVRSSKALSTQRDLSLAYSPGVAAPCQEIFRDPDTAYDYTTKGNMVAVISNGTAVLGLGNLGALASKPVMEGKAVLFKRFADIDGIDLEIDAKTVDEFVNCVKYLAPTFGGINLEDIAAPDCFVIERRLRAEMNIPVFHDDQHGTAIISTAALINALHLTGRDITRIKVVMNGAGAAALACSHLFRKMGLPEQNLIVCDRTGVIYKGRKNEMNEWKAAFAVDTNARTLEEATKGADVLVGLSAAGAFSKKMIESMAERPIIFAMANPDPEIRPEEVLAVRPDAIMATGRSDYPNQVNNVLGFPYIFRGALDVRATEINDDMKIAAAQALAELAREDVPDEVDAAYAGRRLKYGPEYIIPVPFDPRLLSRIPLAVARAAVKSGVARKPIEDFGAYARVLRAKLDPTITHLEIFFKQVRANPQRVIFAEGEQERMIRAALLFKNSGYGTPILIGREDVIAQQIDELDLPAARDIQIVNAANSPRRLEYIDMVYRRLRREGFLQHDCQRMVNTSRNMFSACMVKMGDADAMITGLTRNYFSILKDVGQVFDVKSHADTNILIGINMVVAQGRTVFIADTTINELPSSEELVNIAKCSAAKARELGHEPRVAFLSFSNFGYPMWSRVERVREAIEILDSQSVDFEYEGEMSPDIALDYTLMKSMYPFSRLSGAANVLIMPGMHTANISAKLLEVFSGGTVIGPLLTGFEKAVQIVKMGSTVNDLVTMAALAAHDAIDPTQLKKG